MPKITQASRACWFLYQDKLLFNPKTVFKSKRGQELAERKRLAQQPAQVVVRTA